MSKPPWWPAGADEEIVRGEAEWGCEHCQALLEALEEYRAGRTPDGANAHLGAYAGAGGDD